MAAEGAPEGSRRMRPAAKSRLRSKRGSTRMQSLGFLGSGTAFGVRVHKKDGLHLSQAWFVIVILVALYITKADMLFLFQTGKAIVHGILHKSG